MIIELDFEIYKWLKEHKVIQPNENHPLQTNGKIKLDEYTSKQLINGFKVAQLIQSLSKEIPQATPLPPLHLDKLKDSSTPAARVYNWNIIQQSMNLVGVPLNSEVKSQVISGDSEMINEMLKDLLQDVNKILLRSEIYSGASSRISQGKLSNKQQKSKTPVNINDIESYEDAKHHHNEIKNLQQRAYLEEQKQKMQYNGDDQLEGAGYVNLETMDTETPLNQTQSLLEFFLVSLSKSLSMKPKQSAALLSNGNKYLAHVLVKGVKREFEPIQNWLQSIYINLKRVEMFIEASEQNIMIFLQTLKPALVSKSEDVALWGCRIYGKLCFDLANMDLLPTAYEWFTREHGGLQTALLCLQRHENICENVVGVLIQIGRYNISDLLAVQMRKFSKENSEYLSHCYQMFPYLSDQKLSKDELVTGGVLDYWMELCIKISEFDLSINTKESRLMGLRFMTEIWILVDPLIKQIQVSNDVTYFINIFDTEFFQTVADHTKMKLKISLQLLDLISKQYLNDIMFAPNLIPTIQTILTRFIEEEAFQEYTLKLVKIALAMFYTSCKSKKGNKQVFDNFQGNFDEHEILFKQKRALIIELLKFIILLRCSALNEQIKPLIVHVYLQLKDLGQENKGIVTLLNLFGSPQDIVQEILELQQNLQTADQEDGDYYQQNEQGKPNFLDEQGFEVQNQGQQEKNNFYSESSSQQENSRLESQLTDTNEEFFSKYQESPQKEQQPLYQGEKMKNKLEYRNMEKIEQIQQKRKQEELQKQLDEEKKQRKMENMRKKAEQEIQRRNVQLGVGHQQGSQQGNQNGMFPAINNKNKGAQNDYQLIYSDGELENQQQDELNEDTIQVLYQDLRYEEIRDRDSIRLMLKRYSKGLQFLFSKYNNTTGVTMKNETFDKLGGKNQVISHADLWKFIKDFEFYQNFNIQKQFIQILVKKINQQSGNYQYLTSLDFENYQVFMLNIAHQCFSAKEKNLSHLPVGIMLEEMFKFIQTIAKKRGESTTIFQDPDTQTKGPNVDQNQMQILNRQLMKNPNLQVPEQYRKVQEKQQFHEYKYRSKIKNQIEEKWIICSQILNDVLFDALEISCMEASCKVDFVTKVKPKGQQINMKYNSGRKINSAEDEEQKQNYNEPMQHNQRQSNFQENQLMQQYNQIQNQQQQSEYRPRQSSHNMRNQNKSPIYNKALQAREQQEFQKQKEKVNQDKKQRERQQELKDLMEQIKAEKREKELKKKEGELQKKQEQIEKERRKREQDLKRQQEQKKKLQEFHNQQQKEKEQKIKEEKQRKLEQEQIKKQQVKEFMKVQKEKLVGEFEKQKIEKEQTMMEQKLKEEQEQKNQEIRNQKVAEVIQKDKLKREEDQEFKQSIQKLKMNNEVATIFLQNQKPLKSIFDHYVEYNDFKLEKGVDKEHMQLKGIVQFTQQCNISPFLLSIDDVSQIVRSIQKERQTGIQGLTYTEFEFFLLRIAVKGRKGFNDIKDRFAFSGQNNQIEMLEVLQSNKDVNQQQDYSNEAKLTTGDTITGLLTYLNFPSDKNMLYAKLRALKAEKNLPINKDQKIYEENQDQEEKNQ